MMLLERFRYYSRHCQGLCCRALAYLARPALPGCRWVYSWWCASTTTGRCLQWRASSSGTGPDGSSEAAHAARRIHATQAARWRCYAPQKVDPALIARFRLAMLGCFVPPDDPTAVLGTGLVPRTSIGDTRDKGRFWIAP